MKLLTNENNANALKIAISAKLSSKPVAVVVESPEKLPLRPPRTVPQLALESGTHLFSSNAAAKFLCPPNKGETSAVNYYLDLQSSVVQPLAEGFLGKVTPQAKTSFDELLNQLNSELASKSFLAGANVTVGDVSVWCSLYPLLTDDKLGKDLLNGKDALKKWFDNIHKLPAVQESLKSCSLKPGLSSLENVVSLRSLKLSGVAQVSGGSVPHPAPASQKPSPPASHKSSAKPGAPEKVVKEKEIVVDVTEEERREAKRAWTEKSKRTRPVKRTPTLPVAGERNVLITAALPYVNNVPHLGNIIGCVLSGDVFARYCRMRGYNTLYVCGTDEYGTATETKALEEGLTPKEICDKYFKIHDAIYKWFNISFDKFGRTTTAEQTEICQDVFKKVHSNGFILPDVVEQLLCEKCDRYLADRFVEGTCPRCSYEDARGDQCDGCGHLINAPELIKPRCKVCRQMPVLRQSKQFFLDLPKVEPLLRDWMQTSWTSWSHNAREISKAWLADGLKPRCITRDLKWGIPVPMEGFENKVFYVWFDAPIGYMSITKTYTDQWRKWWMPDAGTGVNLYQFMAKDNVPFHSVMFPASLIATRENYVKVSNIFATEYLNYENGKFSKSRGVGVFGNDAQDTGIPADVWRFYLLYVRPESQDSSFSWADLALKNNSELLSTLGNFINRALMFCEKNFDSTVPNVCLTDEDYDLVAMVNRDLKEYVSVLEKGKLREGIRHLLSISRLGNQWIQSSQPWVLCKGSDADRKRCETVIGLGVNLCCLLTQLLDPYMPETANVMRKQLNLPAELNVIDDQFRLFLPAGHKIGKPFPLFDKIEEATVEALKAKYAGKQGGPAKAPGAAVPAGSDVASLEAAVAAQGDVVRKMKSAGKDKSEWGPQVTILLDLKKKLAEAQAKAPAAATPPPTKTSATQPPTGSDVASLEAAVAAQGDVVRKMKSAGKDKSEWGPQVTILLDLKKKLAEAQAQAATAAPAPPATTTTSATQPPASAAAVAEMEEKVKKQGDLVRKLKESGADKSQWQPEVNVLLDLKKQLAELKGEPLPAPSGKKNKKK